MNPKIDPTELNWKDYTTTAIQWISILGGVAVAIVSGVGGNMEGLATGIGMAVAGLAGGKQGSLLEDSVRKIGSAMKGGGKVMLVLALAFGLAGCATSHPLLQPASIAAAISVAQPYLVSGCETAEIYAGYRLDWTPSEPGGDPDFKNGFGGIFGGCDKFAKISCLMVHIPGCTPTATENCQKVDCKVAQVLVPAPPPAQGLNQVQVPVVK